ncbi:hypothetical protein B0H17DRAFT_1129745 [Mycena rosella]|uniref:Uncharacterized protein n=1 Tax=Mycena rosella TaxID=1033263 RepID=A0AAD7DUT0_MYCRO|nr:hypothetical protein B0H17DRAFT_1129745 [Mycena rosella]
MYRIMGGYKRGLLSKLAGMGEWAYLAGARMEGVEDTSSLGFVIPSRSVKEPHLPKSLKDGCAGSRQQDTHIGRYTSVMLVRVQAASGSRYTAGSTSSRNGRVAVSQDEYSAHDSYSLLEHARSISRVNGQCERGEKQVAMDAMGGKREEGGEKDNSRVAERKWRLMVVCDQPVFGIA